jgi:tetratricopeptide (TPR) repeat protein
MKSKYRETLPIWFETYERAVKLDNPQELAWGLYGQGYWMLMLGDVEEAIRRLEASLQIPLKGTEDRILNASRYGALSLAYLRNGQHERALEMLSAHEKYTPPSSASFICYYSACMETALELFESITMGRPDLSAADETRLRQFVRSIPRSLNALKTLPINKAGVWLYKGLYAYRMGKHSQAFADWRKSIEYARTYDQAYEQARASYELGCRLPVDAVTRQRFLTESIALFEQIGTSYEWRLATSALERLTSASMD